MKIEKLSRLFHTVKYLKFTQMQYRVYYMLRAKFRSTTGYQLPLTKLADTQALDFIDSIEAYESFDGDKGFAFLNVSYRFAQNIDWSYQVPGKLWCYNLNYFDYLQQSSMQQDKGLALMRQYIAQLDNHHMGLEPFPISLRGINWIKFLIKHQIQDSDINNALYAQYYRLLDKLEYHVLGNHLLENGFSLLFGAYYFQDEILYTKAKEILESELKEQVLSDGGHYELSVMYHQIMLYRVLDCYNLVKHNNWHNRELASMLAENASMMLSWLRHMTYQDGTIPHFNDSADHIAPTTEMLLDYADRLGMKVVMLPLGESGYRAVAEEMYELRIDVAEIGPSYIPGHAHSDTMNFELRVGGKPCIVDTGISTYESNSRRLVERETAAHNTVKVAGREQSQVWSSFRVAKRANIISLEEDNNLIKAAHDGYKSLGIIHKRTFQSHANEIVITDTLTGKVGTEAEAYLHFHPDIKNIQVQDSVIETDFAKIEIKGSKKIHLDDFKFAVGYNKLADAKCVKITFVDSMETVISLNS